MSAIWVDFHVKGGAGPECALCGHGQLAHMCDAAPCLQCSCKGFKSQEQLAAEREPKRLINAPAASRSSETASP